MGWEWGKNRGRENVGEGESMGGWETKRGEEKQSKAESGERGKMWGKGKSMGGRRTEREE